MIPSTGRAATSVHSTPAAQWKRQTGAALPDQPRAVVAIDLPTSTGTRTVIITVPTRIDLLEPGNPRRMVYVTASWRRWAAHWPSLACRSTRARSHGGAPRRTHRVVQREIHRVTWLDLKVIDARRSKRAANGACNADHSHGSPHRSAVAFRRLGPGAERAAGRLAPRLPLTGQPDTLAHATCPGIRRLGRDDTPPGPAAVLRRRGA